VAAVAVREAHGLAAFVVNYSEVLHGLAFPWHATAEQLARRLVVMVSLGREPL
jgi:hypothetical protein